MRRSDREITQQERIETIIRQCKVCRLGFVDNNSAYIVPMNFGYQDNGLDFHSGGEGRKVDLLKKSPDVCFEMDRIIRMITSKDACEWGVEYESVIGTGKALIIEALDEKKQALNFIMAQYSKKAYDFNPESLEKTLVFKVTIKEMTGKSNID